MVGHGGWWKYGHKVEVIGRGRRLAALGLLLPFLHPERGEKEFYHFLSTFVGLKPPSSGEKAQRLFFLWDSQWCSRLHLEAVAAHFGKTFTTFDRHWFLFPVESIFGCKKKVFCFFIKKFQHFEVF